GKSPRCSWSTVRNRWASSIYTIWCGPDSSDRATRMTERIFPTPAHQPLPVPARPSAAGVRRTARAVRAYSRFAQSMRITLPVIAGLITLMVIAWPQLGEKPKQFSVGINRVTTNDSGGQQIINARFTGTDRAQRPYTVTADTAAQVQSSPNLVDLSFPKAD